MYNISNLRNNQRHWVLTVPKAVHQLVYAQWLSMSFHDSHANTVYCSVNSWCVGSAVSLHPCAPQGAWHNFMQEEGAQQIFAERVRGWIKEGKMHDQLRQSWSLSSYKVDWEQWSKITCNNAAWKRTALCEFLKLLLLLLFGGLT